MRVELYLGTKLINNWVNWEYARFVFEYEPVPLFTLTDIEVVGEGYKILRDFLSSGKRFIKVKVQLKDDLNLVLLEGVIDITSSRFDSGRKLCRFQVDLQGKNILHKKVAGLILDTVGVNKRDFLVTIVPISTREQYVLLLFIIAFIYYSIRQTVKDIQEYIATLSAFSGTVGIGQIIYATLWGIMLLIQIGLILKIIIELVTTVSKYLVHEVKRYKGFNFYDYLDKIADTSGLTIVLPPSMESFLREAFIINYNPSIIGYETLEFLQLLNLMFNTKTFVDTTNNRLIFYHDILSTSNSNLSIDSKMEVFEFFIGISRFIMVNQVDASDEYSSRVDELIEYVYEHGYEYKRVDIPYASFDLKTKLTIVEKGIAFLLDAMKLLGVSSTFGQKRLYSFKVERREYAPRLVFLRKYNYPPYQKSFTLLDLFKTFHLNTLAHNFQGIRYIDVKLPFTVETAISLLSGRKLGDFIVERLEWDIKKDSATATLIKLHTYLPAEYKVNYIK